MIVAGLATAWGTLPEPRGMTQVAKDRASAGRAFIRALSADGLNQASLRD